MNQQPLRDREQLKGYVTTLSAVSNCPVPELEAKLGFQPGGLKDGYYVYALMAPVLMPDFEWKDRTSYSDGWHFDPAIGEYVQRQDELRAHLGKQHAYNEKTTDRAIAGIMQLQLARLNVRSGPERIVKVLAATRILDFPDSPYRNISQWKLKVPKSFVRLAHVGAGQSFR